MSVLRYFDPKADTTIQTDASQKGLGAALLQHGQPICYASRALTETEQNYSNIERKTLGVVWGLEKFHYFIYGKHCTLHTDHKPLEARSPPTQIAEASHKSPQVRRHREICQGIRSTHRRRSI